MEYLIWNINPDIIAIGAVRIRWYGILFAASFVLGYQIMKRIFLHEKSDAKDLDQLLYYTIGGTIIGARLGHCLFYDPSYYFNNPLKIFAVWEGGLASHGGGIGVLTALYIYTRNIQMPYLWLLDRIAIPTALAASFIRIGNLFNSEILGVPSSVPWAVVFERFDMLPRHPVQVYEALSYMLVFIVLVLIYKKTAANMSDGMICGLFLVLVFTSRFFLEYFKTRQEMYSHEFWLTTGQILSLPFIFAGAALIVVSSIGPGKNK